MTDRVFDRGRSIETQRSHVWNCDFVHCRPDDGKAFRTLNVNDEHSRECLALGVERKLNSTDVIDVLRGLFILLILRGAPGFIRSDNGRQWARNGPEFVAQAVRDRIAAAGARTAYIEPGSPWEDGYSESFNGGLWGGYTTPRSGPTVPWATAHRRQKPSSQ